MSGWPCALISNILPPSLRMTCANNACIRYPNSLAPQSARTESKIDFTPNSGLQLDNLWSFNWIKLINHYNFVAFASKVLPEEGLEFLPFM